MRRYNSFFSKKPPPRGSYRLKKQSQAVDITESQKINGDEIEIVNRASVVNTKDVEIVEEKELQGNLKELIGHRVYLINLLIMVYVWTYGSFGFFLIPFYLGEIPGNTYLFGIFSGTAELLASLACLLVVRYMSLKWALVLFCVISAAGFVLLLIF